MKRDLWVQGHVYVGVLRPHRGALVHGENIFISMHHTLRREGVSPAEPRNTAPITPCSDFGDTHTIKHSAFLATGVATLLLAACAANTDPTPTPATGSSALVKCQGINTCKGTSECASSSDAGKSDCKGLNSCKGQGFIEVPAAECAEKKGTVIK